MLESGLPALVSDPYESIGVQLLAKALKQPIRILIENKTGLQAAPIIDKIEQSGYLFTGFDVQKEEICDMMDRGIVDSLKVV